ncbi:MAG: transposase, partial [Oscillospiraceae bacterium]|nr:transposase [Oscillospiraceae bacterium]
MKLGYDTKSPNPTYFIQKGFRNGKKVSSKNIAKIGRHNELLAQGVADPLAYARDQVAEYNRLYGEGKVELSI